MKHLFLFLFISSVNLIHAQSYTEKYNDLYNRYEYFNNQGIMTGYKYYDNLYKVWKYKDLSGSSQSSYISPINTSLVNQVLATKQARFDENVRKVQNSIDDINYKISEMDVSDSALYEIKLKFNQRVKSIETKNYDYSSNNTTSQIINYLYAEANNIIKTEATKRTTENKTQSTYSKPQTNYNNNESPQKSNYTNYKGFKKASYYSPITSEPTMDDKKIIIRVESGDVYILEKYNDKYYKVKYKNVVGYIFAGWISE